MNKLFEIVNLSVPCPFILKDGSRFDLRTGIPKNSFEVFKTGFEHLGLKPGAEKLFKKESDATILHLIMTAKRPEDVTILALAKPDDKSIQEAAKTMIEQFK